MANLLFSADRRSNKQEGDRNMTSSELELWKRSIVRVLSYWDEERECPWNYIRRTGDGRFEAIATHCFDYLRERESEDEPRGKCKERSLGAFETCEAAEKVLNEYLRQVHAADFEPLDLNAPPSRTRN
jgi:hypothetical protein